MSVFDEIFSLVLPKDHVINSRNFTSLNQYRKTEKEADIKAVDYLTTAKVNPERFANFLYKLSDKENEATKYLTWISTHPEPKDRAEYIIEYCKNKLTDYNPILNEETWEKLKEEMKD